MDKPEQMTEQELAIRIGIIAEAETWLRTPWRHMAHVKGAGVDCAQLLISVFSNIGLVEWFDTGHYPPDWMMHREEERFLGFIEKYAHRVEIPQPGDIAVFKIGRCFSHGAIIVDWPRLIHAWLPEHQVCYGDGLQGLLAGKEVKFYSVL